MPAVGWSSITTGELEIALLAETAASGVAMTTLPPGLDVEPVSLALNYLRPARPQAGNLLARARVVNASRVFVFVEIATGSLGRSLTGMAVTSPCASRDSPAPGTSWFPAR